MQIYNIWLRGMNAKRSMMANHSQFSLNSVHHMSNHDQAIHVLRELKKKINQGQTVSTAR